MVDELQDTNAVQLELIESIANANLFTVGDAQQSIYAFRHADVELFERRARRLAQSGARASLTTNFRSRAELLDALNAAFASELGDGFIALRAGRVQEPAQAPVVELLVADKGADWTSDGLAAPWRVAEARALAARVCELLDAGTSPRDVVLLTRATTDLRAYERALEERGIPTYVIGGRGYWSHPQVVDLVAYLRALANPRDEEALYAVLASPLVGASADALVVLAASSRELGRDPWWVLREPEGCLDDLAGTGDDGRLERFTAWFAAERSLPGRVGIETLIERALALTGYDLAMLALPGGERRLANVRKLTRLGREYEAAAGPDLRGFLELVAARADGFSGARDARESEAPVEGEALDAVRLMTIHRAKGLEFEIVCVADLGRSPRRAAELLRVGRRRPSRPAPVRARDRKGPSGPRLSGARRAAAARRGARGAQAVLRRDDPGPRAADRQRRRPARRMARAQGRRSHGSGRRSCPRSPSSHRSVQPRAPARSGSGSSSPAKAVWWRRPARRPRRQPPSRQPSSKRHRRRRPPCRLAQRRQR